MINHANIIHKEYIIYTVYSPDRTVFSNKGYDMDRRQKKTRAAIFEAFSLLLSQKPYSQITIQAIIDKANVGRSTFYSHFRTKEDLLNVMCTELFDHIMDGALNHDFPSDRHMDPGVPDPVFCHILQHIQADSYHVRELLTSESSGIFLKYFKHSFDQIVETFLLSAPDRKNKNLPDEFLLNHISSSFVGMVQWWIRQRMKQTPEELDSYFRSVIYPIL